MPDAVPVIHFSAFEWGKDVIAPIFAWAVIAVGGYEGPALQVQSVYRFVPGYKVHFAEIGSQRVGQRLIVIAVIGHGILRQVWQGIPVGVGVGPDHIVFCLKVQMVDTQNIDVFDAYLASEFIGPPSSFSPHL